MDITKIFKACVKAARVTNKNMMVKESIMPKSRKKEGDSFNSKALDVVKGITKFQKFLLQCQADYLNEFSHISNISSMSEEERDEIDENAEEFIKTCGHAIQKLKMNLNQPNLNRDESGHRVAVVELIQNYHVETSKLYSRLKAFRVKQAIDVKQMSKLGSNHRTETKKKKKESEKKEESPLSSASNTNKDSPVMQTTTVIKEKSSSNVFMLEDRKPKEDFHFTAEETQMFQEENEMLYNQMNSLVKEIQNIEGKVMEIGQLQEIFHEKVLSQSDQIEGIHTTAVTTTENVNEGNEQIREAIKNSATFRVWILFFLVMCTFSLLFLDWYNP